MDEGTEVTTEAPAEEAKGLRGQLEAALSENKTLKADKLAESFDKIGLDPKTGLGKAIAKEYSGDVSADALAEYAKTEYDWEGSEESPNPQAQAINEGTQRLEEVNQTSGSIVAPNEGDVLAKAEAEGDYATTMAIKGQRITDSLLGR